MPAVTANVRGRLWLLTHDVELRPCVAAGALGVGLAAAVLTDLLLDDCVRVEQGRIYPQAERDRPAGDTVAAEFLQDLIGERTPLLVEVLRGLRPDQRNGRRKLPGHLYERTAAEFVDAGLLRRTRSLSLRGAYRLTEPNTISSVRAQLTDRLRDPRAQAGLDVDALCALAWALDLHKGMCPDLTDAAGAALREITERLPARAGQGSALTVMPHLVRLVRGSGVRSR